MSPTTEKPIETKSKFVSGVAIAVKAVVLGALWYLVYCTIQPVSYWLSYSLIGFPRGSHLGSAVAFFLF